MSESDDILAELNKIRAAMDEFKQSIAPLETQKHKFETAEQEAYQEYLQRVAKIKEQKNLIDQQMFEARKKINEVDRQQRMLQQKLAETKKKEEAAAKAKELQEQYAVLNEKWDLLTAGAPWREWAKDHQIQGGHKIVADRKVILGDTMGLGKTLTSIITCDMAEAATREASPEHPFLGELKDVYVAGHYDDNGDYQKGYYEPQIVNGVERPAGKKILYFCPAPLIRNVEAEFRMWAKHRSIQIIGGMTKAERSFIFDMVLPMHPEWVVICNYEAWRKDLSLIDSLIKLDFDTIIIDEAHNIKDIKSIAYRGIKRLIDELNPPYVIPMTGTPILNRPQELFALLTLVKPDEFHSLNDYLFNYCEQDYDSGFWKFKPGGLDRIAKRISTNFLRRTKADAGIKLPERTITYHDIQVDTEAYPNQAKVRKQMTQNALIMLDETKGKAISAAAKIAVYTRLRQIETWPAGIEVWRTEYQNHEKVKILDLKVDVEESQKIDYMIRWDNDEKVWQGLIPEVIEDERVVVFSQFKAPLQEIKDRIERMGKRAVVLDGSTSNETKELIRQDFDARYTPDRSKATWDVVVCNYKVGGVGMNMTAATQMIILDEEWNPGKRDQAFDRIHRIGQENPVTIHVLRNHGTIDDWLASIMEAKEDLVTGFNDKMLDVSGFKQFIEDSGLL